MKKRRGKRNKQLLIQIKKVSLDKPQKGEKKLILKLFLKIIKLIK